MTVISKGRHSYLRGFFCYSLHLLSTCWK